MITLNAQVVSRPKGFVLFMDSSFTATAHRLAASGDHLAQASSTLLLDSSVIEVHAGDIVEVDDVVGMVGYLSLDAAGTASILLGNMQLNAPASAPVAAG